MMLPLAQLLAAAATAGAAGAGAAGAGAGAGSTTAPVANPATLPATSPAADVTSPATWTVVEYASDIGIIVIVAGMVLCVARLLRGPHLADRALAVDTLATHLMALVILFTLRTGSLLLFDGVLVLALLGFLTTVAIAQYLLRPHVRPGVPPGEEKQPLPAPREE